MNHIKEEINTMSRDALLRRNSNYAIDFIFKICLVMGIVFIVFFLWVDYAKAVDWKGEALKAQEVQLLVVENY